MVHTLVPLWLHLCSAETNKNTSKTQKQTLTSSVTKSQPDNFKEKVIRRLLFHHASKLKDLLKNTQMKCIAGKVFHLDNSSFTTSFVFDELSIIHSMNTEWLFSWGNCFALMPRSKASNGLNKLHHFKELTFERRFTESFITCVSKMFPFL